MDIKLGLMWLVITQDRDTQSVKARLPDSVDMIPESSLDQRDFAPQRQTARRWRLTQLDYEEFGSAVDDDPKLQALRRLSRKQKDEGSQRRAQADIYGPPGPPRQYMSMQEYSSDSEDFWEQDNSNMVGASAESELPDSWEQDNSNIVGTSGQSKQPDFWEQDNDNMVEASGQSKLTEVSVDDEDNAQVAYDESDFNEEPKVQSPRRLGQDPKKLDLQRSLRGDAYGPPMQYMRIQEYGSEVEDQDNSNMPGASGQSEEPEVFVGDEDDAQVPDGNAKSRRAELLTTVDEFLGSGLDEVRTRDVELVQEERFDL